MDTWEKKADMLEPRSDFTANVVDGKIYVIGGATDGSIEVYDPAADSWERKANMQEWRNAFAASVVDGKIYVIGGGRRNHARILATLATVEVYDPATDTWDTMAAMPEGRSGFSTSVVDEKIFVFASYREFRRTVLIYTPPFRTPRSVDPVGKVATTWGRVKTGR